MAVACRSGELTGCVAAALVHHDTDLYDLKVRSGGGVTSVIATTSNHLFWVPGTRGHGRWVKAAGVVIGFQKIIR